ncbi:MAG: helix-hairpin-helix domain-containing protein [Oscillospiraceae bacterium]|jgi:comEA protein|nr:helix-hairpin-helix domain-containing protein [Oscillospiraceae bacterium]
MKKRVFGAGTAAISKIFRQRKPELLLVAAALVIFALIWGIDVLHPKPVEVYVPAALTTEPSGLSAVTLSKQGDTNNTTDDFFDPTESHTTAPSEEQSAATTPTQQIKPPVTTTKPKSTKVNVNTASVEELQALPYIGQVKAQAIMDYRAQHGAFRSPEDLLNIKGIGKATLEKIRAYLVF